MLDQHAIDAKAHPVEFFKRLEVQVGCAHGDGVEQHLVEKTYDRRIFHLVGGSGVGRAGRRFFFLGKLEVGLRAGQVGDALLGAAPEPRQQLQQRVVRHDHRFHGGLGLELDLVQRLGIGGVGNRHGHLVAALGQRHHALSLHQLGVDGLGGQRLDIEHGHIEQRIGEGFGAKRGQCARVDGAAGQQHVDERLFFVVGFLVECLGLRRRQAAGLHQGARQARHRNGVR